MLRWLRRPPPPHAVPNPPPGGIAQPSPGGADPEALLRRLEWTVLRRLDGVLQGSVRTLMRGSGMDLADLREYQLHDDVRHIDWNVTARLQTPHVRVYTEDREMAAWFLLDLSPSVDFGSGPRLKRQVLAEFVAVLARLLTRHGNRVGALLYGGRVEQVIAARAGRRHVLHLLHAIGHRPGPTPSEPVTTRLAELLRAAGHLVHRRSTLFVVSDFISAPGWEQPLAQLASRHEVVAVRLVDPLERELPDLGLMTLRDLESGEQLLVDTHDAGFRQRFAAAAARREDALRQALARAGVDTLELSTEGELGEAIVRFVELRRQRSRLAAGGGMPAHLRKRG
ncbi:MAG TPA: DUF58 domain-containing protein [Ottowia sp.]|jgi:uncharacterized protein (DUF58 family)|nr:DUF58 domain-containing protein [Burkholderiales bacterium]MCA0310991.1 DUF58 domain-containing protein [Pseudomonadota bacterium]HMT17280.1 DUF58 domain-containing protein [Ottowia sp.]HMT58368.1 DUF58 domain-containing protein [Ottowia sp.]HMT65339.1 DUF58 domain-containing protein [Ottowia sp.]